MSAYSFVKKAEEFLLFLKAFSWETNFLETVGNFMVKDKICKGNLYLTENRLSRN